MNKTDISIDKLHIPRWNELPNVDLYLDQVVNLINSTFSSYISLDNDVKKQENQILTKTMINNYVKNGLIDAPTRKLYSKIQLAKLFVICILKQVYSMHEIRILIKMALKYGTDEETYNNFCDLFEEALYCTYNKIDFISLPDIPHINGGSYEKSKTFSGACRSCPAGVHVCTHSDLFPV